MTIKEYMDYPNGRNVTAMENSALKQTVDAELKVDYGRYGITYRIFKSAGGGRLIFHCKVPSRTKDLVFYDVIIMIAPAEQQDLHSSIELMHFAAFSNSPAFIYRNAQAFARNNMFPTFLSKKMDPRILGMESEKNPNAEIKYERTLYASLKTLQNKRELQKTYESQIRRARVIDPVILASQVQSQAMMDMIRTSSEDTDMVQFRKEVNAARRERQKERKSAPPDPYGGVRAVMKTQKVGKAKMARVVNKDKNAVKPVQKMKHVKKM